MVIVFGVVLALNVGSDPQEDAKQSHLVGKAAPSFDLPNLQGGRVTLADIAGKSAIVNFWNSWCIPCQQEEPLLQRFYAEHKDDPDFKMIGIVRDDETDDVRAYVKDNDVEYTVALGPAVGRRARLRQRAGNRRPTPSRPAGWSPPRRSVPMPPVSSTGSSPRRGRRGDPEVGAVDRPGRGRGDRARGRPVAGRFAVGRGAGARPRDRAEVPRVPGSLGGRQPGADVAAIRADIKRRIARGQSDEVIRQAYIDNYGESILLSPQDSGVSLLVWILPIVVVALGATGIVFALRRNRDEPHLRATEADEKLVERERDEEAPDPEGDPEGAVSDG